MAKRLCYTKLMKPAPDRQAGYTIIEVMIFLIISAAMILLILPLFNGRIQRTQFAQSVQSLDNQIKNIANEVTTGTYPSTPSFNCNAPGNNPPAISAAAGTDDQGSRSDCIFLGKIINFGVPSGACTNIATSNCNKVEIYTVVGKRTDGSGNVINSMASAAPRLVVNPPTTVSLTESFDLEYGTRVTALRQQYGNQPLNFPLRSGVGLFQSFNGNYNAGKLESGSQNVSTWVIKSTSFPASPVDAQNIYNTVAAQQSGTFQPLASDESLWVCLNSADNKQRSMISFQGSGNSLKTVVTSLNAGDTTKCP